MPKLVSYIVDTLNTKTHTQDGKVCELLSLPIGTWKQNYFTVKYPYKEIYKLIVTIIGQPLHTPTLYEIYAYF